MKTTTVRVGPFALDEAEIERVAYLQESIRHYLSSEHISPLEILGIHADTDMMRAQYAERWAKVVYEDTQRVLAFQKAFDKAMANLTTSESLIDIQQLPKQANEPQLKVTDQLQLFIKPDCDLCNEIAGQAFANLPRYAALEIYSMDTSPGRRARFERWVRSLGITDSTLNSSRVTLNFDDGLLATLFPRARVPILIRKENAQIQVLNPVTVFP